MKQYNNCKKDEVVMPESGYVFYWKPVYNNSSVANAYSKRIRTERELPKTAYLL